MAPLPRARANVLNEQIKQQIIALGRLGWSLRRIQKTTGVRRETAATYLREAGVAVRAPGQWGRGSPVANPLPAMAAEAGSQLPGAKPAIAVTTDFGGTTSRNPANPSLRVCKSPSQASAERPPRGSINLTQGISSVAGRPPPKSRSMERHRLPQLVLWSPDQRSCLYFPISQSVHWL